MTASPRNSAFFPIYLISRAAAVFVFFSLLCAASSLAQSTSTSPAYRPVSSSLASPSSVSDVPAPSASASEKTIVIGFLGGHVDHENPHHTEVQLARKLRDEFGSSITAETFENRRYPDAYQRIVTLLDTDHDGHLSPEEKHRARIILYGHSWGGAAVLALARRLRAIGIPVRLTVQVDSVPHFGQNDSQVPPNVVKAVNFYQPQGPIHGESAIKPDDATHTEILGNFRFDYSPEQQACAGYPWWDRYFMKGHIQIECDPKVWSQVESLIRAELPPVAANVAVAVPGSSSSVAPTPMASAPK